MYSELDKLVKIMFSPGLCYLLYSRVVKPATTLRRHYVHRSKPPAIQHRHHAHGDHLTSACCNRWYVAQGRSQNTCIVCNTGGLLAEQATLIFADLYLSLQAANWITKLFINLHSSVNPGRTILSCIQWRNDAWRYLPQTIVEYWYNCTGVE